jgi:FkbM family methyltransferase
MNKNSSRWVSSDYALPPLSGWRRVVRFFRRPVQHQYYSLAIRLQGWLPQLSFPISLPFGARYLVSDSEVDHRIMFGGFEFAETQFLQRYLQPGMTVLDIGAHHGFYSLIASRAVKSSGVVHSFEPSPRESTHLRRNIRLNHCTNVRIHNFALGDSSGTATLYQADQRFDGFNSLRRQESVPEAAAVEVKLMTLDQFLADQGLPQIDFIKMDVEGAERSILEGASQLLESPSRPVILAEVYDVRTKAWGYPAAEIVHHLEAKGFQWFEPSEKKSLTAVDTTANSFDRNLVAVPREKFEQIQPFLSESQSQSLPSTPLQKK